MCPVHSHAEEHERYQRQYGFIQRICALYESSPSDFPQLVDLLQQARRGQTALPAAAAPLHACVLLPVGCKAHLHANLVACLSE